MFPLHCPGHSSPVPRPVRETKPVNITCCAGSTSRRTLEIRQARTGNLLLRVLEANPSISHYPFALRSRGDGAAARERPSIRLVPALHAPGHARTRTRTVRNTCTHPPTQTTNTQMPYRTPTPLYPAPTHVQDSTPLRMAGNAHGTPCRPPLLPAQMTHNFTQGWLRPRDEGRAAGASTELSRQRGGGRHGPCRAVARPRMNGTAEALFISLGDACAIARKS